MMSKTDSTHSQSYDTAWDIFATDEAQQKLSNTNASISLVMEALMCQSSFEFVSVFREFLPMERVDVLSFGFTPSEGNTPRIVSAIFHAPACTISSAQVSMLER
jgi:hypothetical protein